MTRRLAAALLAVGCTLTLVALAPLTAAPGSHRSDKSPESNRAIAPFDSAESQTPRFDAMPTPAADASGQPQIAVEGTRLILSWQERQGARTLLTFVERRADGWSAPRVAASGRAFFVNSADVPSVRPLPDGSLAAHWLETTVQGAEAYDLRLAFSRDGRSWSAPVSPHHDGTKTQHGFASLFPLSGAGTAASPSLGAGAGAGLGLIWLDGRATAGPDGRAADDSSAGAMTLRAAFFAPNGKQTAEALINPSVCDCCPTASAVTADGPIIAFRNRDKGDVRDIHVSRFEHGRWSASTPVYRDNWVVPVCPVNGPALAAEGRRVAIAWFSMRDGDEGHTFVAFSEDAGRTFGPPRRVDEGMSLGRSDIALLPDGSAIVSWIEYADDRADLRLRRIAPDGARSAPIAVAGLAPGKTMGIARLARIGDELLLAWTDTTNEARPRVKVARGAVSALTAAPASATR